MILNIFMHFNKKIECFTQPYFTDVDPEKFLVNEIRSLKIGEISRIIPYKNLDLYYIGAFNDETGEFILVDENGELLKRKLADVGKIVVDRLVAEKGVSEDDVESVPFK